MLTGPEMDAAAEPTFALVDATSCAVLFASEETPLLPALLGCGESDAPIADDTGRALAESEQPRACILAGRAVPRTKLRVTLDGLAHELHVTATPIPGHPLAALMVETSTALEGREGFLAVAAHELKSPITALHLDLERLRRRLQHSDSVSGADVADELERLRRQVRRLNRLTQSFLDASRMQSGLFNLELDRHDLCSVVHEVVDSLQPLARRASCQLRVCTCAPLPLVSDGLRLEQVIHNLVVNALKYGACGGSIEVELGRTQAGARLIVRDHGPGIAHEGRSAIFEPFCRLSSRHGQHSLGLGLYVVREIVAAHEGRVWVEDTAGGGATFVVELPLSHVRSRPEAE